MWLIRPSKDELETAREESLFKQKDAASGTKWLFLTVILQCALLQRTMPQISQDALAISNVCTNLSAGRVHTWRVTKGTPRLSVWQGRVFAYVQVHRTTLSWTEGSCPLSAVCPRFPIDFFWWAYWCFLPHWCLGGISLNIKWLEGMFYALLNFCTAKDMTHSQVLQHLSKLFSSQHLEACKEDEAVPLKFQAQDFVSKIYAKNLSQKR